MKNTTTNTVKNLRGVRALVTGVGRYRQGSNNSAARFLVSAGARVIVTDEKPAAELAVGLAHLKGLKAQFHLGGYRSADFRSAELVIRNQGNRALEPFLKIARHHGARVTTDVSLFLSLAPPLWPIGVTGTRGKSTTTALIGDMLSATGMRTYVGGNMKVSPLTFLKDVWRDYKKIARPAVVLELSSWLLEGWGKEGIAPRIAVITNILRDHLNTYRSMREYIAAKAEIFSRQSPSGSVVLNRDNALTRALANKVPGQLFWFSKKPFAADGVFVRAGRIIFRQKKTDQVVCRVSDIVHLKGTHNLENVLAAVCAAKVSGVPEKAIITTLHRFRGLPDRLEHIRTLRGVSFYNDTTATTPDGAIAALKTLGDKKKIILIAGGKDKELVFNEMAKEIKKYCKTVVLFDGTATLKLIASLAALKYPIGKIPIVKDMVAAVQLAREDAHRGDTILLSPGAASFGLFTNEFDRGAQFVRAVRRLV